MKLKCLALIILPSKIYPPTLLKADELQWQSLVRITWLSFHQCLLDTLLIPFFLFSLMIDCQVLHSHHSKKFHIYATAINLFFSSREHCRQICLNITYIYMCLLVDWPTVSVDVTVTLNAIFSFCAGKLSYHPSGRLTYPSDSYEVTVCHNMKCKKSKVIDCWESVWSKTKSFPTGAWEGGCWLNAHHYDGPSCAKTSLYVCLKWRSNPFQCLTFLFSFRWITKAAATGVGKAHTSLCFVIYHIFSVLSPNHFHKHDVV